MRTWWAVLLLTSASFAIDDSLLFVRDGRVYLVEPGGQPRPVIGADPGWVYALPTWINSETFLVMRLKGGEAGRSHVGIVWLRGGAVAPDDVDWLPALAGSWTIGVNHAEGTIHFLKIRKTGEERFDVYLGGAVPFSEGIGSRKVMSYAYGAPFDPEKRLRFSPDGKTVALPVFPTDVSSTVCLYHTGTQRVSTPFYLTNEWLEARRAPYAIACLDWLGGGRVVLGSHLRGLWLCDTGARTVQGLDVWEEGSAGIRDLVVTPDRQRVYYQVNSWTQENAPPAIRMYPLGGGRATQVLTNAASPDVRPGEG